MGDNGTNHLDELQRDEDALAEEYATEDYAGGTDSSYYDDDEYNYEDSAEPDQLRDLDESNEFNTFGGDDQYTKQFGNGGNQDDIGTTNNDDEENASEPSHAAYDSTLTEEFTDDFEELEEDNFDGENGEENDEAGDIGGVVQYPDWGAASQDRQRFMNGTIVKLADAGRGVPGTFRAIREDSGAVNFEPVSDDAEPTAQAAQKQDDNKGPIKWKKGDEITLELLNQIWKDCKDLEQVRPMAESANKAVVEAINSLGPNLMLKLNNYITKTTDSKQDTIGCLLDLASRTGKRLTYTAMSVVEAIFDQQWTQTTILATLPSVLKTAIATNPLKGILNAIFSVAVPVINAKARKNN